MSEPTAAQRLTEARNLLESVSRDATGQGFGTRDVSNDELIEIAALGEQVGRLIDGFRAEVAHEVDARTHRRVPEDPQDSLAHSYGFPNAVALLQQVTLTSRATLLQRIRVANSCRTRLSLIGEELPGEFPHVGEAFFQGKISVDTAETITRALSKLPASVPHELIEVAEQNLVSHATGEELAEGVWQDSANNPYAGSHGHPTHTNDIEQLARGWVAALDQDGTLPREETLERRYLRIGRETNGLIPLQAAVLPEVAAMLDRMVDAITNPRTNDTSGQRTSTVKFVPTDNQEVHTPRDTRTPDQKRHDALATIFGVAAKHSDMPQLGGEALTLTIQCTEEQLSRPGGTAWIHTTTNGLLPVDAGAARHAGCVGTILRVTQDNTGRIINLETSARIFTHHQRKAILLRDGGCIIPGCGQPASWCEIHHVNEWQTGGPTHTDNGVALCWYHHRHLETHGWEIRMNNGVPEVMAPPWLDPNQQWRASRSVHRPPKIPDRSLARRRLSTQTSRCEVRTPTPHLAPSRPERFGGPPRVSVSWATIQVEYFPTQ